MLGIGAGCRLSVQYHKNETSRLLSGRLLLIQGEDADKLDVIELSGGPLRRNDSGGVHTIEALKAS